MSRAFLMLLNKWQFFFQQPVSSLVLHFFRSISSHDAEEIHV